MKTILLGLSGEGGDRIPVLFGGDLYDWSYWKNDSAKKHRLAVAGQPVHHKETHTSCVAMNSMHRGMQRLVLIYGLVNKITFQFSTVG